MVCLDHIQPIIHSCPLPLIFFPTGFLHSVCECVHVCMSMHVCICEGMCVYVHAYVHACMCVYECMYMYAMCASVYMCKYAGVRLNVAHMNKGEGLLTGKASYQWLQC